MKLAFYGLLVGGLAACQVFGIGKTLERVGGSWTAPPMIAGAVLGVTILALALAFATGFRPQLLPTDRSMVIALVALIGVKVVVSLAGVAATALARG
jgi:hypothetical protein